MVKMRRLRAAKPDRLPNYAINLNFPIFRTDLVPFVVLPASVRERYWFAAMALLF